MKKERTLKTINRSYHAHMKSLTSKGREQEILAALRNGKNTYMRMDRLESSSFDSSWIEVIEDVIFDLGEIIANPRQVTKTEGNIVPIELAKKTGAESVQHLASHTQYIKEIDEYGNVIPSKILSMANEDDIKTYENRFIATFVRRLILFIEKRYEFVSKFAELHDESVLMFKNRSFVEGSEVEIETKIRINHKSDDEISLKSNEYVERIKQMRQYILYFYNSDFMKKLKTEKDVHNPILQTNIIRKNPLYHHCYEVYRFIERYEHLGVKYKVDEQFSIFDDTEIAEINNTLFANYITLKGKERSKQTKGTEKVYKPKILTSIDDDEFVYGPLFQGPIEFLRIDEPYQKYLDSKVRKDLPLHPTKREKEYYEVEYQEKAENKEDLKQKQDLIKRRTKEVAAFEKLAAKIDQEREEARLKLLEQEKQIIKKEEDDLLSAARSAIIAGSLEDKEAERAFEEQKKKEAEIKVVEMSHPRQDPVTYDEAILLIWPNLENAPTLRVPSKDEEEPAKVTPEPVVEEQPQVEEPVEQEPVEEIPEEVPAEEEAHPEEQPVEEAPLEEPVEEEPQEEEQPEPVQPVPAVVPAYSHPHQEPVTYDEAALEIWPNLKDAPALRVAPKEEKAEEPQSAEEPVKETPAQPIEKKRPKIPGSFVVKTSEGYYVSEGKVSAYKEGAYVFGDYNLAVDVKKQVGGKVIKLSDAEPEPVKEKKEEPKAPKASAPKQEKKAVEKKASPKPASVKKESQEKKAPVKQAAPKPAPVEQEKKEETPVVKQVVRPREKIPGRFIVKTMEGYYVNENEYSNSKEDAKVFDDFNLAKDIKKVKGGKIVKL